MKLEGLLSQRKLVLTLAGLVSLLGLLSWATMIRQEDPLMPQLWGMVVATFPGADAETVERLVLDPLEEELAAVHELRTMESTASAGLAVIQLEMRDDLGGEGPTEEAWDEVRDALDAAKPRLPEGAGEPVLDDRLRDQESIVLALSGHPDPLALADAAERLKDALLPLALVSRVTVIADPGDAVYIELDDAAARRLALTPGDLAAQLGSRNQVLPGGSIALGGRTVSLRPRSELGSLEEIRSTPIRLPSGGSVPLASIARVRRGPQEPTPALMRLDGRTSVGVGVIPRQGINVVRFGEAVRQRVAEVAPQLAPVEVEEVIFQPGWVEARLSSLGRSLLMGILIVAGVLILAMGVRLGLVVSAVVPLVALSSLAVYAAGGGVLHQISIAALVIALGMLVDNAVVVAETIQWRVDRGESARKAAVAAVRELAVPLAGATATTIAAFLPMLLSEGTTAEFTRALPVVIVLTLSVSYLFAVFVTPSLSELFLKPRRGAGRAAVERLGCRLGRLAVERSGLVLVVGLAVVAVSFAAAGWVRMEFFPASDKELLVVDLELPEGSHLEATDAEAARLERALLARPEVAAVASFVGRSTPHFYYNLPQIPQSPHLAQLVVTTTSKEEVESLLGWVRRHAAREMPDVEVVARRLEQGPPVVAPIEIRAYGGDLADLAAATEAVFAEVRAAAGTEDVRHTLSTGAPMLAFRVDDAAAGRRGLARTDVAAALYGRTRGLQVGWYRAEEDPVPVLLRSSAGERFPLAELGQIDVAAPGREPVPLDQVARMELEWRPAQINHRNGQRVGSVLAELAHGTTYSEVLAVLEPRLAALDLPAGVHLEIGGSKESSGEANTAMVKALPVGVLLLLGILMAEFRSFRRVAIVLATVPLAAAGVVPGLLAGGQPFGFMSMLGVIALVGVVVNNAIVLLEVVEASRREGAPIPAALREAVTRRVRPILLATATTVAGLLPLAFSSSTMWPPMAFAMISGLLASTLLTLLIVPALYMLLFAPRSVLPGWLVLPRRRRAAEAAAGLALLAVLLGAPAMAQTEGAQEKGGQEETSRVAEILEPLREIPRLRFEEALARAAERPEALAAKARARAAHLGAVAERRAARWPSLTVAAQVSDQDRDFDLVTPFGPLSFGSSRSEDLQVALAQPLFQPARLLYGAPAARADADAAARAALRTDQVAAALAADAFLDVLALDARGAATESFILSLEGQLEESRARVEAGRVLEADALKVELALDAARQDRLALAEARPVAAFALGRAVGEEGPVEPAWEAVLEVPEAPPAASAVRQAFSQREDLLALEDRVRAEELRERAVKAERIPSVEARARWTRSTGQPFEDDTWVEGSLGVVWSPFAAGTRGPRAAAAAARTESLRAERTEARRGVELEVRAALAALETARGALRVGETGIVQSEETLRVERERHAAGRATTNDLLDAEAAVRAQRTRRDLARLEVVRAWVRLRLAMGAV